MLLSVVMSAYNAEKYIKESIDSVLNQSFTDFEFIIINDGSTDSTEAILATYRDGRIIIINQENAGVAKSRNKAISIAKGKYIAILDADDIALPTRFNIQLAYLEINKEYIMIGSNAMIIDEEGNLLYTSDLHTDAEYLRAQLPVNNFFNSSVLFKKDIFLSVGGYDTTIPNHIEDLLLWIKFSEVGKITNLKDALIKYRLSSNSLTNKSPAGFKTQRELVHKIINNQPLSTIEIDNLIDKNKLSPKTRKSLYHLRLANIYLTKNSNQKLAFKNIFKSICINPFNYLILKQILLLIRNAIKSLNI